MQLDGGLALGMPVIHFEIVGYCNAKCPYCITGVKGQKRGKVVQLDVFENVLLKLLEYDIYSMNSTLYLYNWGEPFLHPKFVEIIKIVNNYNMRYALSTNASFVPELDYETTKNLKTIMISLPGFSQSSQDRIHGFNFEKVKDNISKLKKNLDRNNYMGQFNVLFHIYQFNLDEMMACQDFCDNIGVSFVPYYAGINNWWQLNDYLDNKLPIEEVKRLSNDIFLSKLDERIANSNKSSCQQWAEYFMINEEGDIATCCSLPNNHEDYNCGNILRDDIKEILHNKRNKKVCIECINKGLGIEQMVDHPAFFQQFLYKNKMYEKALFQEIKRNLKNELIIKLKDIELEYNIKQCCLFVLNVLKENKIHIDSLIDLISECSIYPQKVLNILAIHMVEFGDLDNIIPLLKEAMNIDSEDATTLYNVGYVCYLMGEYEMAQRYLENITDKDEEVLELINEIIKSAV